MSRRRAPPTNRDDTLPKLTIECASLEGLMRNTRVLFAVSLVAGIGAALAVGCGSSKSSSGGGTPEVDASGDDGAVEASGGPGSGCSPISLGGPAVLCDPGMNLTCCVDLSGGF